MEFHEAQKTNEGAERNRKFNPDECEISRISEQISSRLCVHFIKIMMLGAIVGMNYNGIRTVSGKK